jgi:hypothetical protein
MTTDSWRTSAARGADRSQLRSRWSPPIIPLGATGSEYLATSGLPVPTMIARVAAGGKQRLRGTPSSRGACGDAARSLMIGPCNQAVAEALSDGVVTDPNVSRAGVDEQSIEAQRLGRGRSGRAGPPQHRLHPRHHLPRAERLGDVVVRTRLQKSGVARHRSESSYPLFRGRFDSLTSSSGPSCPAEPCSGANVKGGGDLVQEVEDPLSVLRDNGEIRVI